MAENIMNGDNVNGEGDAATTEAPIEEKPTCRGANSTYVKLVSSDGHVFTLKRRLVKPSSTLMNMIEGPDVTKGDENKENIVELKEVKSAPLKAIVRYMGYNVRNQDSMYNVPDFDIDEEYSAEILIAACFLNV
ncbi:Elongin-C [Aphelenchoides bicaudatus]|nr:Elongin-C [Aphelenchoides bicaudatus]